MKFLTDLFPVILFFAAYQIYDIYVATWVLMGAVVVQLALLKLTGKPIEKMHWITLVLVVAFGGLTLGLRDPAFIMWKPTAINWLLGAAFLLSEYFMQRSLVRRMLDQVGEFPAQVVRNLSLAWGLFFIFLGILNLYVAYNFSEEIWVNFKLFGLMGLSLLFIIAQSLYLARHMPHADATKD